MISSLIILLLLSLTLNVPAQQPEGVPPVAALAGADGPIEEDGAACCKRLGCKGHGIRYCYACCDDGCENKVDCQGECDGEVERWLRSLGTRLDLRLPLTSGSIEELGDIASLCRVSRLRSWALASAGDGWANAETRKDSDRCMDIVFSAISDPSDCAVQRTGIHVLAECGLLKERFGYVLVTLLSTNSDPDLIDYALRWIE